MKSDSVAIIDIDSDRISAAVCTSSQKEKNQPCFDFRFATRKDAVYQESLDPTRLLADTIARLKEVTSEIAKSGLKPKQTYCFLASPFYASQTRIAKLEKPEPFTVTTKLLQELTKTEVEKFKRPGTKLLEQAVMQTKLNRYPTNKPERKRARELELSIFLSVGEETIIKELGQIIEANLHHRHPEFHSSAITIFSAIRELKPNKPSALILHLSGEITELSLFNDQCLAETVSYPLGHNFIIRELVTKLNSNPAAVESLLKIHLNKQEKEGGSEKTEEIIGELGVRWLVALKELLRTLGENHFLPGEIFVVIEPRFAPIFQAWLSNADLAETGIMRKNLPSTLLETRLWQSWCNGGENSVIPEVSLLLDTIFYAKMMGK